MENNPAGTNEAAGPTAVGSKRRQWSNEDNVAKKQAVESNETPEPVIKPKKKTHVLTEDHLVRAEGFRKIYETFPKIFSNKPIPVGGERKALNKLLQHYKQWAFDLNPRYAMEDFMERTETLSRHGAVSSLLHELREAEAIRHNPKHNGGITEAELAAYDQPTDDATDKMPQEESLSKEESPNKESPNKEEEEATGFPEEDPLPSYESSSEEEAELIVNTSKVLPPVAEFFAPAADGSSTSNIDNNTVEDQEEE